MIRANFLTVFLASVLAAQATATPASKYLLLDSRLIEKTEGVKLDVGTVQKHPANPLFKEDQPWEVRFDNLYANIEYDAPAKLYRCWYSPFIIDPAATETPTSQRATTRYKPRAREMGICYATSRDGLHWEKPSLGLVEFNGNKNNNLILRGPHGAGIFRDDHESDPVRRYKMFAHITDRAKGMGVAFSPDGLHWGAQLPCPEINVPGDTHNNAFWSPTANRFFGITRLKSDQRLVALTESTDFIHWTAAKEVLRADKLNQAYAMPVFRYGNLYLGMLMIFRTQTDRVHCELAWSAEGTEWHRIDPGTPLIANSDKPGDYDWGCVYAAATPIVSDDEIKIYYGASNGPHTGWRDGFLALATLKPDRFAGYSATNGIGEILLRSMALGSTALRVNADASKGEVRAELQDEAGQPVPGFTLTDSETITDDQLNATLRWRGKDSSGLAGRSMRLRFQIKGKATVYAVSVDP